MTMASDLIEIFVIGAHLSGMPLNYQLTSRGATLVRGARTAPEYRLFVLPDSIPPKPGLLRSPASGGPGIVGEVWALSPAAFGTFVAEIPAPLGIGKICLEDSSTVSGFLCEAYAVSMARDITHLGGWRAYLDTLKGG